MAESEQSRLRVGYALADKKKGSFIRPSLLKLARDRGIDLIPIDENRPLLDHGRFDCIIQKRTGDPWLDQLREYEKEYPHVVIIDRPESIARLHNRISMLQAVSELESPLDAAVTFGIPKQIVIYDVISLSDASALDSLRFPVVAKPLVADGSARSHKMSLVYHSRGLAKLKPPIVLQEFVNHGGVIFKVFVVGDHVKCVKRKSLPDVSPENLKYSEAASLCFSQISNLVGDGEVTKYYEKLNLDESDMPPQEFLVQIASGLRRSTKLHLFNFDMIRDSNFGNRYLIIDINYFPGYAKMPCYESVFVDFLTAVIPSSDE